MQHFKQTFLLFTLGVTLLSCTDQNSKETKQSESENKEAQTKEKPTKDYAKIGISMAKSTQKVLGKNLKGAMKRGGTIEALKFCNVRALPLTDSMSTHHAATIKRVSDKTRNPINQANEEQLALIEKYKKALLDGTEIKPTITEHGDNIEFSSPILTNNLCLQCHGKENEQISSEMMAKLSEFYPKDMARGYEVNQVRGLWSITFKK